MKSPSAVVLSLIISIALIINMPAAPCHAANATKIAVLNIQEIMRDSLAAKSIRKKLEQKQKEFQNEMAKKEQSLQAKERELAKQRTVLSPDEFEKKVKEFREQATKAQREVQNKRAKLDKAFADALAKIQKSVINIVEKMSKEKGFSAVLPTSQLLYASPDLDITAEVLQQLNKQLPNVEVKF